MRIVKSRPIRAGLSETLEGSDFTSIHERIAAYVRDRDQGVEAEEMESANTLLDGAVSSASAASEMADADELSAPSAALVKFTGTQEDATSGLPFHFSDYLELVDWTGRAVRADKRGHIPEGIPPILTRLGVEPGNWIETVRHFRRHFYDFVGPAEVLAQYGSAAGRKWLRGIRACRRLLDGIEDCKPVTA